MMGWSRRSATWWPVLAGLVVHAAVAGSYDMCVTSDLNPGGVGSDGNITSGNYPGSSPLLRPGEGPCRLHIMACDRCRMEIRVLELQLPPCNLTGHSHTGDCIPGCDHLISYEPAYIEETFKYYIYGSKNESSSYTSISNQLTLVFCQASRTDLMRLYKRFLIEYSVQEKHVDFVGSSNGGTIQSFTSPNFPQTYSRQSEIYTYSIVNTNPFGYVRLWFDDWNISPESILSIYPDPSDRKIVVNRSGKADVHGDRPFLLSHGSKLLVQFDTGQDIYNMDYVGFKAVFQFVALPKWPDKPLTVHTEYYMGLFGGQLLFETCWPKDRVDYIWVVMKYKDLCCNYHEQVMLKITQFALVPETDILEIRSGNTSEGALIGRYNSNSVQGMELSHHEGFYIRLRARCDHDRKFSATFVSYSNSTATGCTYYFHYQCDNERCISRSLKCDGIDHCGDKSDEFDCSVTTTVAVAVGCTTQFQCLTGGDWYCAGQQCDSHPHCKDGSDENNCWITSSPWATWAPSNGILSSHWMTYIPIGLVAVLFAVIACIVISCCAKKKRNARRRRQRSVTGRVPSISASLPAGAGERSGSNTHLSINVEIQHYPDAPPTYEEAVRVGQIMGFFNQGFVRTESTDMIPQPPPYTAIAGDPLPILHQPSGVTTPTAPAMNTVVPPGGHLRGTQSFGQLTDLSAGGEPNGAFIGGQSSSASDSTQSLTANNVPGSERVVPTTRTVPCPGADTPTSGTLTGVGAGTDNIMGLPRPSATIIIRDTNRSGPQQSHVSSSGVAGLVTTWSSLPHHSHSNTLNSYSPNPSIQDRRTLDLSQNSSESGVQVITPDTLRSGVPISMSGLQRQESEIESLQDISSDTGIDASSAIQPENSLNHTTDTPASDSNTSHSRQSETKPEPTVTTDSDSEELSSLKKNVRKVEPLSGSAQDNMEGKSSDRQAAVSCGEEDLGHTICITREDHETCA